MSQEKQAFIIRCAPNGDSRLQEVLDATSTVIVVSIGLDKFDML